MNPTTTNKELEDQTHDNETSKSLFALHNHKSTSKILKKAMKPLVDFQNHFVIKKRAELVEAGPDSVVSTDWGNPGLQTPRDVLKVVLPSTHTYRPVQAKEQVDLQNSTKLPRFLVTFRKDGVEKSSSANNSVLPSASREFLGKSKVKFLIEKFNKAACYCNNDEFLPRANIQFSGPARARVRDMDTVIDMSDMIEPPSDGGPQQCMEKLESKPQLQKPTCDNFDATQTSVQLMTPTPLIDATFRPWTAPELASMQLKKDPEQPDNLASKSTHSLCSDISCAPRKSQLQLEKAASRGKPLCPFNFKNRNNKSPFLTSMADNTCIKAFGPRPTTAEADTLRLLSPFSTISAVGVDKSTIRAAGVRRKATETEPKSPMDKYYPPIREYLRPIEYKNMSKLLLPEEAILSLCEQKCPIPLNLIIGSLKKIHKVGEGVFGEVFVGNFVQTDIMRVYKLVPIEGLTKVNGEKQKTFAEIYPEIAISKQLSKLHEGYQGFSTKGYIRLHNVRITQGAYPSILLETWKLWDELYKSDNDIPEFPSDQLYLTFEFAYGGKDAEAYIFQNARQAFYLAIQIVHILAVGESAIEFEHRDLHWGNILVQRTGSAHVSYQFKGKEVTVPSGGIEGCIIDFTIARMVDNEKRPVFLDLKDDEEQFLGTGDHQFDIYRMMRDCNRNDWSPFCPQTNTYWVQYLADKLIEKGRYADTASTEHHFFVKQLRNLKISIMQYESCTAFVFHKACEDFKKSQPPGDRDRTQRNSIKPQTRERK